MSWLEILIILGDCNKRVQHARSDSIGARLKSFDDLLATICLLFFFSPQLSTRKVLCTYYPQDHDFIPNNNIKFFSENVLT